MSLRPRFSILTILLVMAIVALTIVVAQQGRELGPLRTENRRLRDEVGELSIEDESRIQAIAVRTDEPNTWKWRVWVPDGMQIVVRYQFGEVPKTGVPAGQGSNWLPSGEHWVTLKARKSEEGNVWLSKLETPVGGCAASIEPGQHWFDWPSSAATSQGVGNTTKVMPAGAMTFVLNRMRTAEVNSSTAVEQIDGPTAGYIIWLELQ